MIEIQFIPLKAADGRLMGHARVQGGLVDVRLRAQAGQAQALILTDSGYVSGAPETRIRAGGRVLAVAVHDAGSMRCVGFSPGSSLSVIDVRRSIDALTAPPKRAEAVLDTVPAPAKPTAQEPSRGIPAAPPAPTRRSARRSRQPAEPSVLQTLEKLSRPDDAAFLEPEPPPEPKEPSPKEPDTGEDAADAAAAFAALLDRADAVFRRISAPFDDEAPPLPFAARPKDDAPPPAEAEETPAPAEPPVMRDFNAWSRAVDSMLSDEPLSAVDAVENPFPHIFPGARFVYRGTLCGDETLEGEWTRNGETFGVTAVRGEYSPQPPDSLPGFTRYIRTLQGGFWVRVEDEPRA